MRVERVPQLRCQIYRPLFVAGWPPEDPPPIRDGLTLGHSGKDLSCSFSESFALCVCHGEGVDGLIPSSPWRAGCRGGGDHVR